MKKIFMTLTVLLLTVIGLKGENENTLIPLDNGISKSVLRFHIISISDTEEDQKLKLKVRDCVSESIANDLRKNNINSKSEAQEYVTNNIDRYTGEAGQIIEKAGYSYKVAGSVGRSWFPVKIYGNYIFPEGEYDAFRLRIGKAEGKNWWCVLFPSLCMVDESYQVVEGSENDILEDKGDNENVKFSFRIVEWIKDMW